LSVFWATLRRRWYFLLIALLCTATATYITVDNVGPTYEAKGAVLLIPPVTTVQKNESNTVGNPYLLLDGLGQIRDIVISTMLAQATHDELCQPRPDDPTYESMRAELCRPHPSVTYEVTEDFTNRAPIILITVEAKSQTNLATALRAALDRVPIILTDLQAGLKVGADAEITSTVIVADEKPDIVRKNQIRAGIAVGAVTLALSLLIIGLIDGLLAARRSKRSADAEAESGNAVPSGVEPDTAVKDLHKELASRDGRRTAPPARGLNPRP